MPEGPLSFLLSFASAVLAMSLGVSSESIKLALQKTGEKLRKQLDRCGSFLFHG